MKIGVSKLLIAYLTRTVRAKDGTHHFRLKEDALLHVALEQGIVKTTLQKISRYFQEGTGLSITGRLNTLRPCYDKSPIFTKKGIKNNVVNLLLDWSFRVYDPTILLEKAFLDTSDKETHPWNFWQAEFKARTGLTVTNQCNSTYGNQNHGWIFGAEPKETYHIPSVGLTHNSKGQWGAVGREEIIAEATERKSTLVRLGFRITKKVTRRPTQTEDEKTWCGDFVRNSYEEYEVDPNIQMTKTDFFALLEAGYIFLKVEQPQLEQATQNLLQLSPNIRGLLPK